jgi:hypothetical protein
LPASGLEIDVETLARVIRELPVAGDEAERLAAAVEGSTDDEEFLINAVAAVRLIVDRLEESRGIDSHDRPLG